MSTSTSFSTVLSIAVAVFVILFVLALTSSKQTSSKQTNRYNKYKRTTQHQQYNLVQQHGWRITPTQQQYTPQFNPQMELNLRLPYKKFKEIYPNTNITYDEYKKMQMQSAFKRSQSSQQNHRMVR
ncbi:MAG: hypothetical protein FWH37_05130 [Candidatus Bathyarchaeota archaeon]|nr:hypothetical protein [Candidatus Termiticorpusculum sp.]